MNCEDPYFEALVKAMLGSTEGTFFKTDGGSIVDERTKPVMSTGNSGLSFGLVQLDVANNPKAEALFDQLLQDAYSDGRITESEMQNWSDRADTIGLANSPQAFSQAELDKIESEVLVPGADLIDSKSNEWLQDTIIPELTETIEAVENAWGGGGVFETSNADYADAVGLLAGWVNKVRGNNLNTMEKYLTGGQVYVGEPQVPLTSIDQAPTLENIKYYIKSQKEYREDPDGEEKFDYFVGNVARGENLLPELVDDCSDPNDSSPDDPVDPADESSSPLIMDIDGDGIELTNLTSNAVYWDIDNDGFAEASGWVDTDDGILAFDANGDGIINSSAELFGDQTGYANGFLALAEYDSNEDGAITSEDSSWGNLRVWIDGNTDGFSDSHELHTLDDLLITEIDLGYSDTSSTIAGNEIKQTSTFTIDGNTNDIVDAYFAYDNVDSFYHQDFDFDYSTLDLPMQRGYGTIPALRIAMSLDNEGTDNLLGLVSDLADLSFSALFDETTDLYDDVTEIMYRWAGVDDVPPTSRGDAIDARDLAFLEQYAGRDFLQQGSSPNPGGYAASLLKEDFSAIFNKVYANLVTQVAGGELFTGDFHYDISSDSFSGITGIDSTKLSALETEATNLSTTAEKDTFWDNVIRMVEYSVGTTNLPSGDQTALDDAITNSDASLSLSGILSGLEWAEPVGTTYNGTSGDDTLTTDTADNDTLNGGDGNDTITASGGDDTLNGGNGDDALTGGAGVDYLVGGSGNDSYYYNLGNSWDTILESSTGTGNDDDRIIFGSGIDSGDLTFTRLGTGGLEISIDTGTQTGNIYIEDQFNYAAGGGHVELIEFSDTSTYDLVAQDYTLTGTAGADKLYGSRYASTGDDTIYGGAGDDELYSYAPNQTESTEENWLYGEAGNDELYGSGGTDHLDGGAGDDTLSGGAGNDELEGGAGDDDLSGGTGDDDYIYVSGHDVITGGDSGDDILLDAVWDTVTPDYYKIGNDLQIYWDADNTITVTGHFSTGEVPDMIYDDTTSVDLTTVTTQTQGTSGNDTLGGTTGADTIYGFGGDDTINGTTGSNGDDTLYGGTGDDSLYGGYGADYLDGGAGDDWMEGDAGNDHFFYVSGHDTVIDYDGTDILEIDAAWEYSDLTFKRSVDDLYNVVIEINASNSITIDSHFWSNDQVETLRMNDGTSDVDLTTMQYETHGNASNNTLSGITNGGSTDDIMYGWGGNDTLNGSYGDDVLYGGDGDDSLNGGNDDDTLYGEGGDDTLKGNGGNDLYVYSEGLDSLYEQGGGTDTLLITGGVTINDLSFSDNGSWDTDIIINSGVDEIFVDSLRWGGSGYHIDIVKFDDGFTADLPSYKSWLNGTASNDMIAGGSSDEVLVGFAGDDDMSGGAGIDHAHGGDGDDTIDGGSGADVLYGGADDDSIEGGSGADTMDGGAGTDTVDYSNDSAGVTVDLSAGTATDGGSSSDTLSGFENITGSAYADTLDGDSGANTIDGGAGADDIDGGAGNDTLIGGTGNDTIDGGTGIDRINYSADAAGVTVNLSTGSATDGNSDTDTISNVENVIGSAYADTITGDTGDNDLEGGAGADSLTGGAGSDVLNGGTGADTLNGGDDSDIVDYSDDAASVTVNLSTGSATDGNGDTDTINNVESARGSDYNDTLTGDSSANFLYGGSGNDTLNGGSGADYLYGDAGNDTLNGDAGADVLSGGDGVDTLNGGNDADTLYGGDGGDTLHGDAGNDTLYGMDGLDTLYGDGGNDTFVFSDSTAFNDVDVVKDFDITTDEDVLDISDILSVNGYEDGVDTLTDWVQIADSGSDSTVKVDITGSATFGAGTQIATLESITGLTDEASLVTSGNLVVV